MIQGKSEDDGEQFTHNTWNTAITLHADHMQKSRGYYRMITTTKHYEKMLTCDMMVTK